MTEPTTVDLSVLLVSSSRESTARVLDAFAAQGSLDRIEFVIAVVGEQRPLSSEQLQAQGFVTAKVINGGNGPRGIAEHRALAAASGRFVLFAQERAHPRPGFTAAMLEAARGPWTVIGPSMMNQTPATSWSRAAMWINYGQWMPPVARGVRADVPGHNSAYRREALLALGGELGHLLEAGWPLQLALNANGGQCFLEPAAVMAIENPRRAWAFLSSLFAVGRSVAARRCRRWTAARRATYAVASPLIPFVRVWRIARDGFRRRHDHASWLILPHVILGLVVNAAGECAGFAQPSSSQHPIQ